MMCHQVFLKYTVPNSLGVARVDDAARLLLQGIRLQQHLAQVVPQPARLRIYFQVQNQYRKLEVVSGPVAVGDPLLLARGTAAAAMTDALKQQLDVI